VMLRGICCTLSSPLPRKGITRDFFPASEQTRSFCRSPHQIPTNYFFGVPCDICLQSNCLITFFDVPCRISSGNVASVWDCVGLPERSSYRPSFPSSLLVLLPNRNPSGDRSPEGLFLACKVNLTKLTWHLT
jgi:hypothetical protein